MASLVPQEFDGLTLGYTGDYGAMFESGGDYGVSVSIDQETRRNTYPIVIGHSRNALAWQMLLYRPSDSSITTPDFNATIKQTFDPGRNATGVRYLVGVAEDGVTELRLPCYVESLTRRADSINVYDVVLVSPQPYFEDNALTTSLANPATVTNDGNVAVLPSVALTTATHKTRVSVTVTGVGAGGGVIAYPVRVSIANVGATATNVFVYVEGVSVPCKVNDAGLVTSAVWFLVDTASDGSTATQVDVIYGTGLLNPLAGTLDDGGMNFATSTNASWTWNDWRVSTFPSRPGTWRLARMGRHSTVPEISYGQSSEGTSSTTFQIGAPETYDNEADVMLLNIGAQGGPLTNLSRVTSGLDGTNTSAFVKVRGAGSSVWGVGWTTKLNATVTTSISLGPLTSGGYAIEVAAGIENSGTVADPGAVVLSGTVSLTLVTEPIVSASVVANYDYYNGTYQICLLYTSPSPRDS